MGDKEKQKAITTNVPGADDARNGAGHMNDEEKDEFFAPFLDRVLGKKGPGDYSRLEAIKAGVRSDFYDFEEALKKGETDIDPETRARATDASLRNQKSRAGIFERDFNKNLAEAKKQVDAAKGRTDDPIAYERYLRYRQQ